MTELKPGDEVQYVGNPRFSKRYFAFSAFLGRTFTVLEGTSFREDGDHQYCVNLSGGSYFFGSELKKID